MNATKPARAWSARWRVAVLILSGWGFAALIASARPGVEILEGGGVRPIPVATAFVDNLVNYGWWALLAPAIILAVSRIAALEVPSGRRVLLQAGFAALFIAAFFVLRAAVQLPFSRYPIGLNLATLLSLLPQFIGIYGIIASVTLVFVAHQRLLVRETQLVEARLQALGAQLHPHFLSNALNGIAALVEARPGEARFMIARLGELLRTALDAARRRETLLTYEMEWLERYLEVQQARFDDRIHVSVEMQPEVVRALVPPLILQPVVENAIKHGIELRPEGGRVRIRADRQGDVLRLRVGNDPALLTRGNGGSGVGLQNVRDRLQALYGNAHRVSLVTRSDWVEAEVILPFRTHAP